MLPWDDLRYFLELCRGGTLAAAARRLRVDETTVGRRIAKLEAVLGAKLTSRTPDGLSLTAAGETVRASTEEMERAAFTVERRAMGADRKLSGRVRITAPEVLGTHFVLPGLKTVHDRHPDITIEIVTTMARLDVLRSEADVAVRVVRPSEPELVCRRLGRYAMAAYVRKPARGPARGEPSGVVVFNEGTRPPIRGIDDRLPSAPVALRTNSSSTMVEAVRSGWGAGDLPCFYADRQPDLVRAFTAEPPQLLDLWLVVHADVHRTARVRTVVRTLSDLFARSAALLEAR
jgi:DNA-binding transcriptional LysR family regulator